MNPPGMVNPNYPQNVMPNMPAGNQEVMNNQKPLSQAMQQNAPMTNGEGPENLNIPSAYQNRPISKPATGVKELQKTKSTKSPGRKSVPPGDKKPRDPNSKVTTARKPKVVESIKMQFI